MRRRRLLQGIAIGAPLGSAGCIGLFSDEVELLGVGVSNSYTEEREVEVRISADDDPIVTEEYTLPPNTSAGLDCEWSDDPKEFALAGRLREEDDWVERSLTDGDSDCVEGVVRLSPMGGEVVIDTYDSCDPPSGEDWCGWTHPELS